MEYNQVPHRAIDACKEWEERAQKLLEEPVVSVESAIVEAVRGGRMTPEEAQECLTSYISSFMSED